MSDLEARCRNCGNTGVDMFGKPCVCRYGKALPGLLDTIRNLRTNGTPEGIAEAIKRAGEAQLAAHVAAGGEVPPTIREMEQGMAENEQDEQGQPMTAADIAKVRADFDTLMSKPQDEWDIMDTSTMAALAILKVPALLADATYWRGQVEHARAAVQSAQTMMDSEHMRRTERLLEQMDACWEIVRAVANVAPWPAADGGIECRICHGFGVDWGNVHHAHDCPVTQARAVLAAAKAAQTEAEA